MRHGKPIIGISGGIGSGKTFVADLFGEMGCLVIKSDEQVLRVYEEQAVLERLRAWWGEAVLQADGKVNRRFIADRIFNNPDERRRLEQLLHPHVAHRRKAIMRAAAEDPQVLAYVWDTPLLFETGLDRECDVLVFVDAPFDVRLKRVVATRGWDREELIRREKFQRPLDTKRRISDHVIRNTADAATTRSQVREVLSRILLKTDQTTREGRI